MKNDTPSPPFHPSPTVLGLSFWNLPWPAYTREISPTVASLSDKSHQRVSSGHSQDILAAMKEERRGGATTEERLEAVLRELCGSRGNRATVCVDKDKRAQTITLQTQQMRHWLMSSPEVQLIDTTHIGATHNTNELRYKIFSFMVNNVYGHGQYVYHSLPENDGASVFGEV
ncbi:hypothetical protein PR002_g29058, partial [Phytophthora rubi]